jgi:SAM-dependent methyltransferase
MFRSESLLEVDGVTFEFGRNFGVATQADFFLSKPHDQIDGFLALVDGAAGNVVELGIFRGGSAALMALAAPADRIVVIDLCDPVDDLDRFIVERGLQDRLRAHYRVDQSDGQAVAAILDADFEGAPLDLVIDDASHQLGPTRASFDEIFPRLRPGGRYLIEDWHLELTFGAGLLRMLDDDPDADTGGVDGVLVPTDGGQPILATLATELLTAFIVDPEVVASVSFDRAWISVERGPAELPATGFRLQDVHRGLASLFHPDPTQVPDRP